MAEVLIDFKVDYTQLDGAIATLEKTGQVDAKVANSFKATNQAIAQQSQAIKKTATDLQGPIKSIDQLDKRSKTFVQEFIKGFEQGVKEELLAAKSEIDQLRQKFEQTGKTSAASTNNIKKELKDLVAQIAQAKATGGPVSQEMIQRAGELKDAISDANAAVKDAGSDTKGFDNLIGAAQTAAGGFAVLQGAAALFGDEGEELQKTLLKVNAAMSVLQGLQAIQNSLTEEGAVTLLAANIQQRIMNAQLALETAAQSKNIIVKGLATVAQRALNAAVSVNPYLLIVTALLAVIPLILKFAENTREAAEANAALDSAIRRSTESLKDSEDVLADATERRLIAAQKAGKSEVEQLQIQKAALIELHRLRTAQFEENQRILDAGTGDLEKRAALEKEQENFRTQARKTQIEADKLNLQIQQAETKAREDAAKKQEEALEKANEKRRQFLADRIDEIKRELLIADETKKSYKSLETGLINLQAQYDAVGASAARTALIMTEAGLAAEKVLEPVGKKLDIQLQDTREGVIDTTKALGTFAQDTAVTITQIGEQTALTFEQVLDGINEGLQVISDIGQGLSNISQERQRNQQIELDNQRKVVDELLESGAITEKEAIARQQRIDRLNAQAQAKQAQRDKQLAIFAAIVNTAQAVTKALTAGPVIGVALAAVTAALGAAQIAAIAARPLPRFATGKIKGQRGGVGIVGDAGAELIEQGGRMWVATKPTVTYLGPDDIVHTASRTKNILPYVDRQAMRPAKADAGFDYDRLAKAIHRPENGVAINIDKEFISESVAAGLRQSNYYDRRYSFKS